MEEDHRKEMVTEGTESSEIIIAQEDVQTQYPENVGPGHEINKYAGFEESPSKLCKPSPPPCPPKPSPPPCPPKSPPPPCPPPLLYPPCQRRPPPCPCKWRPPSSPWERLPVRGTSVEINKWDHFEDYYKMKMKKKRQEEGTGSNMDLFKHASLHREASNRNWKFVREYIENNPDSRFAPISDTFETLLHVVVGTKEPEALKLLEEHMDHVDQANGEKSLEQTDMTGMTALHYAAVYGNAEAARILLRKNRELLTIKDQNAYTPLYYAAKSGQAETVHVLLESGGPTSEEGLIDLVDQLITTNLFGIALSIIKNYSQRPFDAEAFKIVFNTLATKALAFRSGSHLGFWQELVYKWVPIERKYYSPPKNQMRDVESLVEGSEMIEDRGESTFLQNIINGFGTVKWKAYVMIWKVVKQLAPGFQQIDEEILKHKEAYLLLKHLCKEFKSTTHSYEDAISILKYPVLKAATTGIHEIVTEVLKIYPNSIIFFDEKNCNALQLAVLHRREEVFVGIMERSNQSDITLLRDGSGNNVLHYAGKRVTSAHIPGAALQMQKEMQWFKVLENLVHPSLLEGQNHYQETPWEVFIEEHRELMEQGEKWMKNTATSCTVVAALITTMVFAAAFTVPGGNNGDEGTPIFLNHSSMLTFLVADTLALISSSTSILIFLGILTSRYSAIDFLESLPKKLMFGLITLFFSIASMIIAFGAAIHIVLFRRFKWVDIPFSIIACFPVILFIRLQFPLLIDIYMSTYRSKICQLKR